MEAEEKTKQTNCNYNRAMTVKWRKVCAQNIFSFSPHTRTHNKEMSVIYRLLLSFLKGKNCSPNHFPDDDVYEAKEVRHTHKCIRTVNGMKQRKNSKTKSNKTHKTKKQKQQSQKQMNVPSAC